MPSFFDSVKRFFPAFLTGNALQLYSRRYPSCFFLRLPLLVYLDYIFPCLAVEDIICLRRVNKAFFLITHEPSIWRRFLSRMNHHPVVYLRPTFDYSNKDLYYEAEQIVTRTISLDDNWRASQPKVITRILLEAHYEVLDMSLLPGGKYMVASVRDKGSYHYYLILYILDHPSGPQAIARVQTFAKVFRIQTRYMRIHDKHCILITCVRRCFYDHPPFGISLSQMSHEHSLQVPPYFSEVLVFYVPMNVLEYIGDPNIVWGSPEHERRLEEQSSGPFHFLTSIEIDGDISQLASFDNEGAPWVVIVTNDLYISFHNCRMPYPVILKCTDHPDFDYETIRAILPLPKQKQILVVRQCIIIAHREEWVIELYDFPIAHSVQAPTHYIIVKYALPYALLKVLISEPLIADSSPKFPKLQHEPLPPVSIYFQSCTPYGLMHFSLWPVCEQTSDGKIHYISKYIVDPAPLPDGPTPEWELLRTEAQRYYTHQSCHQTDPQVVHVLPGNYRAVYYTTSKDDRRISPSMLRFRRYLSPEIQKITYPERPKDNSLAFMRSERPFHPSGLYGCIEIGLDDARAFSSKGINAIAWDESIGRVCVAVQGELGVRILDMGLTVEPDQRFAGWKGRMSQEIAEQDCWCSRDCSHTRSVSSRPSLSDWLGFGRDSGRNSGRDSGRDSSRDLRYTV